MVDDYFTDIVECFSTGMAPSDIKMTLKKQIVVKEAYYQFIVGNLYNLGIDGILRCCVTEHEIPMILA
jgi:hypothetical protein